MIYTITCNPSLDYLVGVKNFAVGQTNRSVNERLLAGGKGINVSVVLQNLGVANKALGFVAGFTGEEIVRQVKEAGVECEFIRVKEGLSRINIKLQENGTTEVNGRGSVIGPEELELLRNRLGTLQKGDILVLSGSVAPGIPDTFYAETVGRLSAKGVMCVVDATGKLVLETLQYGPFLVKPNHHELGELFGVEIRTREEAALYGAKLREMGARNVLVSMGAGGAVLVDETGNVHAQAAPVGQPVSDVGAGDSMVAGFLAGWLETGDYSHAFRLGVAAGSASAFCELLATGEDIRKVYKMLV